MIDFTEVTGWNVGNAAVVKASLNGEVVWGHDVDFKTWTNTQAPPNLSTAGLSGFCAWSIGYPVNGATKLKFTVERVGTTREYTSSGLNYKERGTLYLCGGDINKNVGEYFDEYGYLQSTARKLKTVIVPSSSPSSIGDSVTYSITIPSGITQLFFVCEPYGYYGTQGQYYGYLGANVFKFIIALNA